jgi:hypothetical protein
MDYVIIIINKLGQAKLNEFNLNMTPVFEDELFYTKNKTPEWLFNFYDWLRTVDNKIIGISLHSGVTGVDPEIIKFLISLDSKNSMERINIFFDRNKIFDKTISDDADFGGNIIYHGNKGSIALTFNSPTLA